MTNNRPIEIIIADDHELIREGFAVMFAKAPQIKILAEAKTGTELVKLTRRLQPEVVVTDIKMPGMDGVEAAMQIKKEFPHIGIVALTTFDETELIYEMRDAGAVAYVLKDSDKEEMIAAIKAASNDETYFCHTIQARLNKLRLKPSGHFKAPQRPLLNLKELQILRLVCEEYINTDIAKKLKMGKRTVEDYRRKLLEKTNSKNTAGLVKFAIKNKLFREE